MVRIHPFVLIPIALFMLSGCVTFEQPAAMTVVESRLATTQKLILQEPRLGEITDLRVVQNEGEPAEIHVLGTSAIAVLRQAEHSDEFFMAELVNFQFPPIPPGHRRTPLRLGFRDITGDGRLEVLQLGGSYSVKTLSAFNAEGALLWQFDPDYPLKGGFADHINDVEVLTNKVTGERRVIVLSSRNEYGHILSSDGRIISQFQGNSNRYTMARWKKTGNAWDGIVLGRHRLGRLPVKTEIIGLDGEGTVRFRTPLPRKEYYVSMVSRITAAEGDPESYYIIASRSGLWDPISSRYILQVPLDENGVPHPVLIPYEAEHHPIRASRNLTPVTPQGLGEHHAVLWSAYLQAPIAGLSGIVGEVRVFEDLDTETVVHQEFLKNTDGSGMCGQVLYTGAMTGFAVDHPNDALIVGWGNSVRLIKFHGKLEIPIDRQNN